MSFNTKNLLGKNYVLIFLDAFDFSFKVLFTFFHLVILDLPFHTLVKRLGILTINMAKWTLIYSKLLPTLYYHILSIMYVFAAINSCHISTKRDCWKLKQEEGFLTDKGFIWFKERGQRKIICIEVCIVKGKTLFFV